MRRLSLNFAVLRSVFSGAEQLGSGPVLRLTAAVLTFASRWWQLETLYRSQREVPPAVGSRGSSASRPASPSTAGSSPPASPRASSPARRRPAIGCAPTTSSAAAVRAIDAAPPAWTARHETRRGGQALVRHRKLGLLRGQRRRRLSRARAPHDDASPTVRRAPRGLGPGAATGEVVSVVGRIVRLRDHGGLRFAVVREDGADVQVMLARDVLGPAAADLWGATVDRGDQVSVTGEVVAEPHR